MSDNRSLVAALALSAASLVGIAVHEGYRGKAYPDPVRGTKVPTIGFGTTAGVRMGDTTTPVLALQRKLQDLQGYQDTLKQCIKVPLYQHEFDAYVDLAYNIGPGAFCASTVAKRLAVQDYPGACNAILLWKRVGDVDCSAPGNTVCAGLWVRRLKTHRQCLGQDSFVIAAPLPVIASAARQSTPTKP